MIHHSVCWIKLVDVLPQCCSLLDWIQLACIQSCNNSIATNTSVSLTGPQNLNLQFWLLDDLCLDLAHDQLLKLP